MDATSKGGRTSVPSPLLSAAVLELAFDEHLRGACLVAGSRDAFELIFLDQGSVLLGVGAEARWLDAGSALIVAPGHSSCGVVEERARALRLRFTVTAPHSLSLLERASGRLITPQCGAGRMFLLGIARLMELVDRPPNGAQAEMQMLSALFSLIDEVSHHIQGLTAAEASERGQVGRAGLAERLAERIETLVAAGAGPVLAEIARESGVCVAYLNRLFHLRFGMAPREYIARCRAERARALLLQTSLSLEVIAERLGFGEASHFTRQFKRWTGLAPSTFRAQARNKDCEFADPFPSSGSREPAGYSARA